MKKKLMVLPVVLLAVAGLLVMGCSNSSGSGPDTSFVAVTDITVTNISTTVGVEFTLSGTVSPANATNKAIVWMVKNADDTGATITENKLTATAAGEVTVTATIINGASATTAFTKDFTITVNLGPPPPEVKGISLIVMNGNGTEANFELKQLPPGARVIVNAEVEALYDASEAFTVSVDFPAALNGKITVVEFDEDDMPGSRQIDISNTAGVNKEEREWITVTVASDEDSSVKAEWKFVVWGDAVIPGNSFNVQDTKLGKLPNLTVPPGEVHDGSVPMSSRYRLAGNMMTVFREDETASAVDNLCDEENGKGYIFGEDLEKIQAAPAGSILRLYFSSTRYVPIEPADNPEDYPLGYKPDTAGRNGWGVLKVMNVDPEYKAPNNSANYYIDVEVGVALAALEASGKTELFFNIYNSSLQWIELWEQIKPITWTDQGAILTQDVGAAVTMMSTGDYEDQHALLRSAGDGSYLLVTIESYESRPGWGVCQIGGTTGSRFFTVGVPDLSSQTNLETGHIRFTAKVDVWTMLRNSQFSMPLGEADNVRFNVWNLSNITCWDGTTRSGIPIIKEVKLFTIDD
jgi:hypothetical protein